MRSRSIPPAPPTRSEPVRAHRTPSSPRRALAVALLAPALLAAGAARAQTTTAAPAAETDTLRHGYTGGDVRFMQQMIGHHAQALDMAELVPSRSARPEVRTLAERIRVSQTDEIALMRHWLEDRHEAVPAAAFPAMQGMHGDMAAMPGMQHDSAMHAMHGMMTAEEMGRLAATTGDAFDRGFLEGMIRHHEGALAMVAQLFSTTGAGQDPDVFRLASDIDAGQRAEIARMQALLATLPAPPAVPHR